MTSRPLSFVTLSSGLTGFTPVQLHGTGMASTYLDELDALLPASLLDRILNAYSATTDQPGDEHLKAILDDPDLGPIARNIIVMWFCGTWTALPAEWRSRNDAAEDSTHVVSPAAYQAGLQWVAAGAHPAGARQQGFGAWSTEPPGTTS
jgi:hypothetical protein